MVVRINWVAEICEDTNANEDDATRDAEVCCRMPSQWLLSHKESADEDEKQREKKRVNRQSIRLVPTKRYGKYI